jgi:hypothetical protein
MRYACLSPYRIKKIKCYYIKMKNSGMEWLKQAEYDLETAE